MTSPSPCSGLSRVARVEDLPERDKDHDCGGFGPHKICVKVDGVAELPTRFGRFKIVAFWNNRDGKEHIALVHGDVLGAEELSIRLHSECLTGDALGAILYMRQEGRGIGLVNKVRAYSLQDRGLDTVEANLVLGFRDDERDYAVAAHMLASLNVGSIQLMTNNPRKIEQLESLGIEVSGRIPHVIPATEFNRF